MLVVCEEPKKTIQNFFYQMQEKTTHKSTRNQQKIPSSKRQNKNKK